MLDLILGVVLLAAGGWLLVKAFQWSPSLKKHDENHVKNEMDEASLPPNNSSDRPGV
ncbi:hypothetical protein [Bacillus sp. CGMCC 1.16541]|uniref:hypothetical protein n=1 Tax=Bacillus sp. CGMCC 1.16541 TaxID=2185143 RepID=UPI0013A59408|nr:hypothetical protein [Bacillus sp. CGMCC 1.16541]